MAEPSILVPASTLVWAVHYALGRQTYAATDMARLIVQRVSDLDQTTRDVLARDIERALHEHAQLHDDQLPSSNEWRQALFALEQEG